MYVHLASWARLSTTCFWSPDIAGVPTLVGHTCLTIPDALLAAKRRPVLSKSVDVTSSGEPIQTQTGICPFNYQDVHVINLA